MIDTITDHNVLTEQDGNDFTSLEHPQKIFEDYIDGISYPATKEDLFLRAHNNQAPGGVLYVLNQFTNKTYQSFSDVLKELHDVV